MFTRVLILLCITALLSGCPSATTPVPTDESAEISEYFWNAPVGTVNVLSVTSVTSDVLVGDSIVTQYFWYYKVIQKDVQMPEGGKGVMCTTWYSDKQDQIDTIIYFIQGRSLYYTYPAWMKGDEKGLMLTMPVKVGDSLKLGRASRNTHHVIATDEIVDIADTTYRCVVIQQNDTLELAGKNNFTLYTQELYYAKNLMQVRYKVNRVKNKNSRITEKTTITIDLVEVKLP